MNGLVSLKAKLDEGEDLDRGVESVRGVEG